MCASVPELDACPLPVDPAACDGTAPASGIARNTCCFGIVRQRNVGCRARGTASSPNSLRITAVSWEEEMQFGVHASATLCGGVPSRVPVACGD